MNDIEKFFSENSVANNIFFSSGEKNLSVDGTGIVPSVDNIAAEKILIYIKNNSPTEGIIIEDKTNPEKNISHEFKSNEIFKASDIMVDSLTNLLDVERKKRQAS